MISTEAQINRYLREESPRLLSLSKQEDFGDFSKFKISEKLKTPKNLEGFARTYFSEL